MAPKSSDYFNLRGEITMIGLDIPGAEATCLTLPEGLTYEEWCSLGHALGRLHRAHNWWVGDWLLRGEHVFGEKFAQAAAETGLSEEHLKNTQWVAAAYAPVSRHEGLTWTHHFYVAALDDREDWLAKAEMLGWTANELLRQVKGEQRKQKPPGQALLAALRELANSSVEPRAWLACLTSAEYNDVVQALESAQRYLRAVHDVIQIELITRDQ